MKEELPWSLKRTLLGRLFVVGVSLLYSFLTRACWSVPCSSLHIYLQFVALICSTVGFLGCCFCCCFAFLVFEGKRVALFFVRFFFPLILIFLSVNVALVLLVLQQINCLQSKTSWKKWMPVKHSTLSLKQEKDVKCRLAYRKPN